MSHKLDAYINKSKLIAILGIVCLLYILNLGLGRYEIIRDNIPFIGNIDEVFATIILLACLRYFGYDFYTILKLKK